MPGLVRGIEAFECVGPCSERRANSREHLGPGLYALSARRVARSGTHAPPRTRTLTRASASTRARWAGQRSVIVLEPITCGHGASAVTTRARGRAMVARLVLEDTLLRGAAQGFLGCSQGCMWVARAQDHATGLNRRGTTGWPRADARTRCARAPGGSIPFLSTSGKRLRRHHQPTSSPFRNAATAQPDFTLLRSAHQRAVGGVY